MPSWNPVPTSAALEGKILTTRPVDTLVAELQETKVVIRGRERRGFKLVLRDDQNSEGGLFRFHISLLRNFDVKHPFIALNGQVLPAKLVENEWIEVEIPHFSQQVLEIFSGSYSERWNDKTNGDSVTLSLANVHSPSNVKIRAIGRKGAWTIGGETFQYRMPVTIDNTQNASALTDYQVLVTVDTASLIAAGKMNADCSDIRFTDSDGATKIPYWIEPGTENSAATKIWVKVPSIPASGTKTIYMYYGNSAVNSESDANSVFDFYDDFEGTSLSNKWSTSNVDSLTVSSSILTFSAINGRVQSTQIFSIGKIIEWREKYSLGSTYDTHSSGFGDGSTTSRLLDDSNYVLFRVDEGYTNNEACATKSAGISSDVTLRAKEESVYRTYRLIWTNNYAKLEIIELGISIEKTTDIPSVDMYIGFDSKTSTAIVSVDWVRVRKYSSSEPTITVGAEETAALNTQGAAVSVNGSAAIDLMYVNGSPVTELADGQAGDWIDIDPALLNQGDGVTNTLTITTANNSRVDIEFMMDYKDDVVVETFTFSTPGAGIVGEVKDTEIAISAETSSPRFDFSFSKTIDSVQAVRYERNDGGIINLTTDPTARPYYATSGNILTVYTDDLLAGDKINIRAGVSFYVSEKPPIYTAGVGLEVEKKEVILEVRLS